MTKTGSVQRVSRRLDGRPLSDASGIEALDAPEDSSKPRGRRGAGQNGQAKILPMEQVPALFVWLERLRAEKHAAQLVFGFSFYGGLRAGEIAGLTWRDVTDCHGQIDKVIHVPPAIAKYHKGRDVPMHPCIAALLVAFRRKHPLAEYFALNSQAQPRNENALTVWFHRIYRRMGLPDCSSHSGRRSLITFLANNHGRLGMSLHDVQLIAGHANLSSTERYIEPSADLHRLITSVPWSAEPLEIPSASTTWPLQMQSRFLAPPATGYPWEIQSMSPFLAAPPAFAGGAA